MANPSLQQEDNEYESEIPTSSWGRFLSADQAEGDQAFTSQPLVDANVNFNHVGEKSEIVDTIPGFAHDITNIGDDELIVIVWANENFDHKNPDTIASKV